jgi:hypothetical protein
MSYAHHRRPPSRGKERRLKSNILNLINLFDSDNDEGEERDDTTLPKIANSRVSLESSTAGTSSLAPSATVSPTCVFQEPDVINRLCRTEENEPKPETATEE